MIFTDPLFLFYFLPLSLILVRLATWRIGFNPVARLAIVGLTLVFYGFANATWPILFLGVVGGVYVASWAIELASTPALRRCLLGLGIAWPLLALAACKYLEWITGYVPLLEPMRAWVASWCGAEGKIELPPGISFYVFEAITYLVDIHRRAAKTPRDPTTFFCFIAMFPRFIAGPIVRYGELIDQLRTWGGMRLADGLALFSLGFCLKVLFADSSAVFADAAFAVARPDFCQAWLGVLGYTFQIYFDFWGYSLMATGIGLCLGFRFPDNFRSPYHAFSIGEFWRRWHITLSSWIRDYLYFPLGGSRGGTLRTCVNLILTMTIAGIWHGANLTFLVWGMLQGVLMSVERLTAPALDRWPKSLRIALTMFLVMLGWVLFRSPTFDQALHVYRGLFGWHGFCPAFHHGLILNQLPSAALALGGIAFCIWGERLLVQSTPIAERVFPLGTRVLLFALFLVALLMSLSSASIPFLYFQF